MRATLYFAVPEDMIVPYAAETTEQATHSGMRIVFCETPRAEAIVGPVRKYSIGAVLLDKRDPSKVLARSCEPLVRPEPSEREGYVPNVVYTCGAMRHNDQIILPYAVSDTYSNFATIEIAALRQSLEADNRFFGAWS
jgi:beta-1,4-mannooligosaccharide phosphorylase